MVSSPGSPLFLAKVSKLPIADIMKEERLGGWGKSIYAAQLSMSKLKKNPDTQHLAIQLQQHIECAIIARSMQPARLAKLAQDHDKYVAALQMFKDLPNFEFPPLVIKTIVGIKMKQAISSDCETAEARLSAIIASSPWSLGQQVGSFDPLQPRLCDVPVAETDKFKLFDQYVIKQMLVPTILAGESSKNILRCWSSSWSEQFDKIDRLSLSTFSVSALADFEEIIRGISGLAGGPTTWLTYQQELSAFHACATSKAPTNNMLQLVASAVSQNDFYKAQLGEFIDLVPAMTSALPAIEAAEKKLDSESAAVKEDGIVRGVQDLLSYQAVIPEVVFNNFASKLRRISKVHLESRLATLNEKVGDPDIDFKGEVAVCTNLLHELSLVFPTCNWPQDLQSDFALLLRDNAAKIFSAGVIASLEQVVEALDADGKQPPSNVLAPAAGMLSECQENFHLKSELEQELLAKILRSFLTDLPGKCKLEWEETCSLVLLVLKFVPRETRDPCEAQIQVVSAAIQMLSAIAVHDALTSPEGLDSEWHDKVRQVMHKTAVLHATAKGTLSTIVVVPSIAEDAEAQQDAFHNKLTELLAVGRQFETAVFEMAKCKYKKDIEELVAEVMPYAKGDKDNTGASWMGERDCKEWDNFEHLALHYNDTLKMLKPSLVKSGIKKCKELIGEVDATLQIFDKSASDIDLTPIKGCLDDLILTKLSVMCMRTLAKKTDEGLDKVRPPIQAELNEALGVLGTSFPWQDRLPTSLAQKMSDVIAARVGRSSRAA